MSDIYVACVLPATTNQMQRMKTCWWEGDLRKSPQQEKYSTYLHTQNKNTLLYNLTYNTRGYFASCVVYENKLEQRAKCPHVLYVKPYNKEFIIPLAASCSSSVVLSFFFFFFLIQPVMPDESNRRARVTKTT